MSSTTVRFLGGQMPRAISLGRTALIVMLGLIVTLGSVRSARAQAAYAISDFSPVGYVVTLDGREVAGAEIFQSRAAGAFLILAEKMPAPIMIRIRDARVDTVDLMKVNRLGNGMVELLPNATLETQGSFRVSADRTGIEFSIDGRAAELREKPALLGMQDIAGLTAHSPEYQQSADEYQPSDPILGRLKEQQDDVEVRVFFGTWCSACKQMVPRIMKVAEGLKGSRITFSFYGLPPGIAGDPEAARFDIHSVPTGVVFRDGREIGRISGAGWKIPELALNNMLVNSSS